MNKKTTTKELTLKKLKTYKWFENSTEHELKEGLNFIKVIVRVLAEIYKRENK